VASWTLTVGRGVDRMAEQWRGVAVTSRSREVLRRLTPGRRQQRLLQLRCPSSSDGELGLLLRLPSSPSPSLLWAGVVNWLPLGGGGVVKMGARAPAWAFIAPA
jgi:hypothetical protein